MPKGLPLIQISGEMGETTSAAPGTRTFMFYRCTPNCNSSRLHLGGRVRVVLDHMEATNDDLRRRVLEAVGENVPTVYLFGFTGVGKTSLISTLQTAARAPPAALIGGVAMTTDPACASVRSFDVEVLCNGKTKTVAHMVDTRGWADGTTAESMEEGIARTPKRRVAKRLASANCILIVGSPVLGEREVKEYRALKGMLERANLGYITGWVLTGPRTEWQPDGHILGIVAPLYDRFFQISNYVPRGYGEDVPTDEAIDHQALRLLERIVCRWSDPELELVSNPVLALWETAVHNFPVDRVTNVLLSTLSPGNLVNLFVLLVVQNFPMAKKARRDCPYLDTIDRSVLDFDFEKLCSVTLSNINVYACLVCGNLQADHHVFLNLETERCYCLPDGYEVQDTSLEDIRLLLRPRYSHAQVARLDANAERVRCLVGGGDYLPGFIGLNNVRRTDYVSVVVQALAHVGPLRDFLLLTPQPAGPLQGGSVLALRFCELVRKVWSPHNYKGQVSPHELLQAVQSASAKRFRIGVQSDPLELLQWLLNALHRDLAGTAKHSVIHEAFQGEVEVTTFPAQQVRPESEEPKEATEERPPTVIRNKFLFLPLDLPPMPVFKDGQERNIIPQVPLHTLLAKYNGHKEQVLGTGERKRYLITRLPRYLILTLKRFAKNTFFVEKNLTIVNFPVQQSLDLRDYVHPSLLEKGEQTKYSIVSAIKHEGKPESGVYSVFVQNKADQQWFEIQDLNVRETIPQLLEVAETYIQIYERKA
eukprot:m51a1_g3891 hypothetical protein (762) ;mRNA; f:65589-74528